MPEPLGAWQKPFVAKPVGEIGISQRHAMQILGLVCDLRCDSYRDGFYNGVEEGVRHEKERAERRIRLGK